MSDELSHLGSVAAVSTAETNRNGRALAHQTVAAGGRELQELPMTELLHGLARSVAEAQQELELDGAEYELAEAVIDVKVSLRMGEVDDRSSNGARRTSPQVLGSIVGAGAAGPHAAGADHAASVRLVLRPAATRRDEERTSEGTVWSSWS